ncbi:uncharacterized protein LOC105698379 [Orussus abietinus]|uniref:uncharacterized protein LOC105698379 n=1 Tax=Orussus abietinus TaxID=222816 RepID=UPI000625B357|nr:uncharacterized protein LOC105698379 [Orussus abietinus]
MRKPRVSDSRKGETRQDKIALFDLVDLAPISSSLGDQNTVRSWGQVTLSQVLKRGHFFHVSQQVEAESTSDHRLLRSSPSILPCKGFGTDKLILAQKIQFVQRVAFNSEALERGLLFTCPRRSATRKRSTVRFPWG